MAVSHFKENISQQVLRIRLWSKNKFDSIDNEIFKKNIQNAIPFWVSAFITGFVAVFYAKLFAWAEKGSYYIFSHFSWTLFIITPACFYLAYWIVTWFAPYARGSGIPQVTAAIQLTNPKQNFKVNHLLGLKIILVKIASSLIMIFGGGVVGREGPTIQISASIFKLVNDYLPSWYPKIAKRNMIVTGAAAGLAAAFNTPLGGIVFAIEELTKTHFNFFKSALLAGVIISGLTALNILGPYLYLGYPTLNGIHLWIIIIVIPIAIISGLGGSQMGKMILYIFERKKSFFNKAGKVIYPIAAGLIIAAIGYFINVRAIGSGKELMVASLFTSEKHMEWYMPILRLIGPIISFTNGAAGGIFAPALSAGASIGSVVASWFSLTDSESNLMILCGMVGCLTGITRSPFTSSILVIEMTNSHNIIFHLMLTGIISNAFANLVSKDSFYDHLKEQYIHEIEDLDSMLIHDSEKTNTSESK